MPLRNVRALGVPTLAEHPADALAPAAAFLDPTTKKATQKELTEQPDRIKMLEMIGNETIEYETSTVNKRSALGFVGKTLEVMLAFSRMRNQKP
jgi:hypothetical protein